MRQLSSLPLRSLPLRNKRQCQLKLKLPISTIINMQQKAPLHTQSATPSPPPAMMRSLVAPRYCEPAEYEIEEMPVPSITEPDQILVRVHAAAIVTGDTQAASGKLKMLTGKCKFPMKIGGKAAGIVVAVGSDVTALRPGDAVYGVAFSRPMNWEVTPGFCSEYAVGRASLFLRKPAGVPFTEAVALLGNVVTAVQSFDLAERLMRKENGRDASLKGKTVFVPGALSATGNVGVQLAKHAYGAARVVATASTPKVPLVAERLPAGTVDQVIDYQATPRLVDAVGRGAVDFVYNTQWDLTGTFPLLRPETGVAVSIASLPPYSLLLQMMKRPPGLAVRIVTTLAQWWYHWKLRGTNIKYDFVSGNPGVRADLEKAGELIAEGKVKAVMNVVPFNDIEAIRKASGHVFTGKGGVGTLVIEIL